MSINKIQTMGQIPSRFGMPTPGHPPRRLRRFHGLHHRCARFRRRPRGGPHLGSLPGDLCLETTDLLTFNSIGSLQAADPNRDPRPFLISRAPTSDQVS